MVAAEQIKSALAKLNSYVPFLGIIVKNTYGLSNLEMKDESGAETSQSAHNSISHLNYTEKKTEQMLAPAGLVNWQKIGKIWKKIGSKVSGTGPLRLKTPTNNNANLAPLSQQTTISAAKMIKEKMAFGRSHSHFFHNFKTIAATLINLFNPLFWRGSIKRIRSWFVSLHPKNKMMFSLLAVALLILAGSLVITGINNSRRQNTEYFNNLIIALEEKKNMVDSYLLYNNQEGAKALIGENLAALDALPVKGEEQIAKRDQLRAEIEKQRAQVQKLTTVDSPELIGDFKSDNASAETHNLIVVNDKIFAADPAAKAVYTLDPNDKSTGSYLLTGDFNALDKPVNAEGTIYYLSGNRLISVEAASGKNSALTLDGIGTDDKITAFQVYNGKLYGLMADSNQIYRFNRSGSSFNARTTWVKEDVQLGDAVDLAVTGDVYVLKNNGKLQKFYVGRSQDFNLAAVDPTLDSASLLKATAEKILILDKNSKRLLIFDKQGQLLKQFRFPSLNNIKDFSFSDDVKTAYLLNDDSVYKVNLE